MSQFATFKASADLPGMIPGVALVPLRGTSILNVFLTGGLSDATRWIAGDYRGFRSFDSSADASSVAEGAGAYLARRADHFVIISRGGCFDPDAS